MQKHGLQPSPELIVYGEHTFSGGYQATRELLAARVRFTAMLASNDESALGAMRALKEANRQIPQDVAVIGFDDRPETLAEVPALTSVHIPLFGLGYRSLKAMFDYFQGKEPILSSFNVPTRLVVRHSCGCRQREVRSDLPAESAASENVESIAQAMARTVVMEAQHLDAGEIESLCRQLVEASSRASNRRIPITLTILSTSCCKDECSPAMICIFGRLQFLSYARRCLP
jgi:hypothetical protein